MTLTERVARDRPSKYIGDAGAVIIGHVLDLDGKGPRDNQATLYAEDGWQNLPW